jgi:adenine-specific DNA-methyltransferase
MKGVPLQDIWTDISPVNPMAAEKSGFPTQKPEGLLDRVIRASSNPGDLVLDCFIGSGTTAAVAQNLGRRWIGCDINKGAIQTTAKRLQAIMREQAKALDERRQGTLVEDETSPPPPVQLAFTTYRVNDYDLQIQHNEAVALACEHIGVTRTRADGYFDGTLGKRLVKIVPFNHPLTPLDLDDLRKELHRRPEEERDIVLVCLGMELAARAWIEDYNRGRPINKVHVIELRTDRKYGGFIRHEPLTASVSVRREQDKLIVEVQDVLSPTILQRLNMDQGLFRAQVEDWRAVVDCIMIDTDHDGEAFNVALSDVPARKQDLVEGRYELAAPRNGATVAVKVIDMLGEETVVTEQV